MFKPTIHYSHHKDTERRLYTAWVLLGLFILVTAYAGLHEAYRQTKLEGAAEYKQACISNYQAGYLTVRTECQPGYRSR